MAMAVQRLTVALVVIVVVVGGAASAQLSCADLAACRARTHEAIAAANYELAHDYAWLAYQKQRPPAAETLALLARTQSLSGRGDDAFVMLRRIAEAGALVPDLGNSSDFARVRGDARWPELLALFERNEARRVETREAAPAATEPPSTRPGPASTEMRTSTAVAATKAAEVRSSDASTAVAEVADVVPSVVGADLAMGGLPFTPSAMAYDAVSARFILSTRASDVLTVLSQTSATAAALTSRGWSGMDRTTAIAIDRPSGDLWVAAQGESGTALHRLQLISGRRLDVTEWPSDTRVDLTALLMTPSGILALDRSGRRILRRESSVRTLVPYVTLPTDIEPTDMARAPNALFVAHAGGILRIDPVSRKLVPLSAGKYGAVPPLSALAWHGGVLIGIQQSGETRHVIRLRLNSARTAITSIERLGTAAAAVGTLSAGVYYYLADDERGQRVVRAISVE